MRFFKTPLWVRHLFPQCIWSMPASGKVIYLTFDDGPIPQHTDKIIKTLAGFDAKATFFCVGDNIRKFPEIAREIKAAGHAIGNHTFHHVKAWSTQKEMYMKNVDLFEKEATDRLGNYPGSCLFRPPHGQLTPAIYNALLKKDYKVIMWDLLSYDFDRNLNAEKALAILKQKTKPGSIVVFHDNYKAELNLQRILPEYLSWFSDAGFRFATLNSNEF